jgi:hypothetical protein
MWGDLDLPTLTDRSANRLLAERMVQNDGAERAVQRTSDRVRLVIQSWSLYVRVWNAVTGPCCEAMPLTVTLMPRDGSGMPGARCGVA